VLPGAPEKITILRMETSLQALLAQYDPDLPLQEASTIPRQWYTDRRIHELEQRTVFGSSWQFVARMDQLAEPGQFVTVDLAGEPLVLVKDGNEIRAFYNACRHHATQVMKEPAGVCSVMQCPYHGWTYGLDGKLKAAPDMGDICNFDKAQTGLVPVRAGSWNNFIFVNLDPAAPGLEHFLGDLPRHSQGLDTGKFKFFERRTYEFQCNWKVYMDNYLDGGYHIPILHKSLNAVIDYAGYTIENGARFCLQKSPLRANPANPDSSRLRRGEFAHYYWLYPNFMLNWYEGVMDTNLVLPVGADRTLVIFDFYFDDVSEAARERNKASVDMGERIQHEDQDISIAVQMGLNSRSYQAGRLSVRREAGEHLFHRLVAGDLKRAMEIAPAFP
jgi:choline monooxygenase